MPKREFLMPGEGGQTQTVTVAATTPVFMVIADGADTPTPAVTQKIPIPQEGGGVSYQDPEYGVGARVQCVDQSPQTPIVTGRL